MAAGQHSSIDEPQFDAFNLWWQSIDRSWGVRCFEGAIDLDTTKPGLQLDCSVSDVVRSKTHDVLHETVLPQCNGNNRPCWTIFEDRQNCPSGDSLTIDIERVDFPARGTNTIGYCATQGR